MTPCYGLVYYYKNMLRLDNRTSSSQKKPNLVYISKIGFNSLKISILYFKN